MILLIINRLFKENPDLEGDSLKVVRERRELISELEVLLVLIIGSNRSDLE